MKPICQQCREKEYYRNRCFECHMQYRKDRRKKLRLTPRINSKGMNYCVYRKYQDGYVFIRCLHYNKFGFMAEHKFIAEKIIKRRIKKNEHVHHKNFIKDDNRPENLIVMDKNLHMAIHYLIKYCKTNFP